MPTRSETFTFAGGDGQPLAARLDRPVARPRAFAVFAHCFACSRNSLAAARISTALAEAGIAVLRFDFTGVGGSGGDLANAGFTGNVADLVAAAEHLRRDGAAPALLIGHSLGGAAVLAAAARVPECRAVITLNAPSDPAHVLARMQGDFARICRDGAGEVALDGRRFTISRSFIEDVGGQKLIEAVHGLRRALLIFHAPRDEIVGIDHAAALFQAALHPKSFVSLDDADHLLTRRADAEYAAAVIAAWASRYLSQPPSAELAEPAAAPGTVVVAESGAGRLAQTVAVGRHLLRADEPLAAGGDDTGPSPYDYLLAALGACTAMTLRLYAERKGLALDRVAVRLAHRKIHAQDCADCLTREGRIDRIERDIELVGALDAASRQRLLEIADKCPVHRTLHGEVSVTTRLVGEG